MAIRWRPAEVVMLHKFCDVKGCDLEMEEQAHLRPPLEIGTNYENYRYQYRCPNGHVATDRRIYPRWEVRPVKKPKVSKEEPK